MKSRPKRGPNHFAKFSKKVKNGSQTLILRLVFQNTLNTISIFTLFMVDGVKREGITVLDKISSSYNKTQVVNEPVKEENKETNHSTQTVILTILAAIAIVGGLALVLGDGLTGASIGTLTGPGTATTVLTDSSIQGATTSTTEGNIGDSNSGSDSVGNQEGSQSKTYLAQGVTTDQETDESNSNTEQTGKTIPNVDSSRTNDPINFELQFSNVPEIDATVSLSEISLLASNLGSSVRINGDLLEANSEVTIDLSDFLGRFKVNAHTTTLDGTISQIHLNGVSLLSDSEISIEIDALSYDAISTDDISFSYMYFPAGDGQLEVADRLSYKLKGDSIDVYDFYGQMILSTKGSYPVTLIGESESLESSSNVLQLGVQ